MPRIVPLCTLMALVAPAVPLAWPMQTAMAAPATASFQPFFARFRAAVLAADREKVADMVALPFKDFSGGDVNRSATTRTQFLSHYAEIFTPAVVAGIKAGKVRSYSAKIDGGEAPGPLGPGEYLLDTPEFTDQLVFTLKDGRYLLTRTPFYS